MHAVHHYGSVDACGAQLANQCGAVFFPEHQIHKDEGEDILSNPLIGGFYAGDGFDFVAESLQLLLDARAPLRVVVYEQN
jgi:hypothetical protein